jgi:hypothetical protein
MMRYSYLKVSTVRTPSLCVVAVRVRSAERVKEEGLALVGAHCPLRGHSTDHVQRTTRVTVTNILIQCTSYRSAPLKEPE